MAGPQQQQQQRSDQQFLTSAFSVYATEVRKAISNQQQQLIQLEAAQDQLQQTLDSLEQLPTKLRHPVMVPMGKHAFFPGHITRTNEIMVHLGGQYYVEATAAHARGILQRKQAAVADGITKAQQQLKALRARLEVSSDSIGSATDESEAHEIRSSLAESDALLASAPPRAGKPAAPSGARQQQQQQQQQQQAQRVRSSSGYSYTRPQGAASTEQRSPQQDAEDAQLQALLEQLLLLEQQHELQDVLQDAPTMEQQQLQLGPGLGTIQEGEEDSDDEPPAAAAAAAAAAVEGSTGGVGSLGQLSAVHHLQQLEAQSDSDDDVAAKQPQPEQQQQHTERQRPPGQVQQRVAQQQFQQQRPPLKSALKKGFLGTAAGSSSSGSRARAADRSASTHVAANPKPAAFTGTVVERTAPQAAAAVAHPPAARGVVEGLVQLDGSSSVLAASGGSSGGSSSKPMSRFKMRRLGLDPQDD